MKISYEENALTATQFTTLKAAVGRDGYSLQVEKALTAGLYNIIAKDGDDIVGMGRLVGDGVIYWYVQDVVVKPEYQARGIGKKIMAYLLQHIEKNSLPNTKVSVGLMAAEGKEGFYEKLGFFTRPNETYGAGMMKFYHF